MWPEDERFEPEVLGLLDALLEASVRYAKIRYRVRKEGARIIRQAQVQLGLPTQRLASLLGVPTRALWKAKVGRISPSMALMLRLWMLLEEQEKRIRLAEPAALLDEHGKPREVTCA